MDFEGCSYGIINILAWHLPGGTGENSEKP
jgi:hypothetical protein